MYIFIYAYISICVCINVYIYVYTYTIGMWFMTIYAGIDQKCRISLMAFPTTRETDS